MLVKEGCEVLQVAYDNDTVNYSFGLPGRFVLQVSWSRTPGEWWYKEIPGDLPSFWTEKCSGDGFVICLIGMCRLIVGVGFRWR